MQYLLRKYRLLQLVFTFIEGGVHVQVEPNRNDNVPRFAIVANPTIEQQVAGGINPTAPKQSNITLFDADFLLY